ncbi:IMPACT family protein [Prevotella sp. HCN-7019]|mgnify:FL=1|uniref:IMPACT family protein n=1 Tax=Prevotella sp. HCN-7019 TaxID=3134668 RepID=UPI0030BFDD30
MDIISDEYKTVTSEIAEGFYSEKRSKFYAFVHHVTSEDEIKAIIAGYHKSHYDARHICYAYVLGSDKTRFRANDDGEPSSTAGKPILGQIIKNDLTDILVIVIRYYGGVNLGTSGLIVAYRTAAADAISRVTVVTRQIEESVKFKFPYELTNSVMKVVKELSPRILSNDYNDNICDMVFSIRKSQAEILKKKLKQIELNNIDKF